MPNNTPRALRAAVRGAGAGLLATLVMSALMLAARRAHATPQLPPETIARRATQAVTGESPSATEGRMLGSVAHLAFGAAAGSVFGLVHHAIGLRGLLASVGAGLGFANAVYLVSYQGWVPALRILPPATDDDPNRVRTMVAAHWVFGAALGFVTQWLSRGARRSGR